MDYKLYAELATMAASFNEVTKLFALTPEQAKNPNAGKWVVDRIRQYQTAYILREQVQKKVDFPKVQAPGLPPIEGVREGE